MARRLAFALLAVAAAGCPALFADDPPANGPAADAPITFAPKFPDKQVRYVNIKSELDKTTIVSFFPDPISALDQREWWFVATSAKPQTTGVIPLTWKVDRLQALHRDRIGREQKPDILFDSLRPSNPPQAGGLNGWTDRAVMLRLNPAGRVTDAVDAPTSRPALPSVSYGSTIEIPTLLDVRQLAAEFYGEYLPTKPVKVGESWTRNYVIHRTPYGTLHGPVKCTLRAVDDVSGKRIARIDFAGDLQLTPDPATTKPNADTKKYEVRKSLFEGAADYDLTNGEPLRVEVRELVDLNMIMTSVQPAAKPPPPPTTRPTTGPTTGPAAGATSRPTTKPPPNRTSKPAPLPAAPPASQPATQPAPKVLSFSFQMSESRKSTATFSKTAPIKPIVVRPPTPTQPARPPNTTSRPYSPPSAPPRRPTTQPGLRLNPITPATTTQPASQRPS